MDQHGTPEVGGSAQLQPPRQRRRADWNGAHIHQAMRDDALGLVGPEADAGIERLGVEIDVAVRGLDREIDLGMPGEERG